MDVNEAIVKSMLSILGLIAAVQDIRTRRISNVLTFSTTALSLGYRIGSGVDGTYFVSLILWTLCAMALFATGQIGGGDAKLMLSLVAWRPDIETWAVTLLCLAVIGGVVLALRYLGGLHKWLPQKLRWLPQGGLRWLPLRLVA